MSCLPDSTQADAFTPPIWIPAGKPVSLRVAVDLDRLHFAYRVESVDHDWRWLPLQFDASILADEAPQNNPTATRAHPVPATDPSGTVAFPTRRKSSASHVFVV